jgi:hypothetical protein
VEYYDESIELIDEVVIGDSLPTDFVVVNRPFNGSEVFGIASLRVWLGE